MKYEIMFERIGRSHTVPPLQADVANADDLAYKVWQYSKQFLASREINVTIELDPDTGRGNGTIQVGGFRNAGNFDVAVLPA